MSGEKYIGNIIEQKLLNVHTADVAKVLSVSGNMARLQPLTMRKVIGGKAEKQAPISAIIPKHIKVKEVEITYKTDTGSETQNVLVPANLTAGDIVCVGFCERDISDAKRGKISEATNRHHNANDGIILCVL